MKKKTNTARLTPGAIILRLILAWLIVTFVLFPNINIIIDVLHEDGQFSTSLRQVVQEY